MKTPYLFKLFLIFGLSSFLINQNKLNADYFFNADRIDMIQSNDSNFDLDASNDNLSCSSGGGSIPSFWVGTSAGEGSTTANNYDGTEQKDDYLAAGLGFNIPLGSKNNYRNCDKLLSIVETDRFLKMMKSLKELGVMDDEKLKNVVNEYLSKAKDQFGIEIDLLSY